MGRGFGAKGYSLVELLVAVAIAGLIGAAVAGVYRVSQDTYVRASSLEAAQGGARAGLDRMANELRLIGSFWVGVSTCPPLPDCNSIRAATSSSITFMASTDNSSVIAGAEATVPNGLTATGTSVPLSLTAEATDGAFKCYSTQTFNDYIYIANGSSREARRIATTGINNRCTNDTALTLTTNLSTNYPTGSLVRDVKTITYALNGTSLTRAQGGSGNDTIVDNVSGLTFTYFDTNGVSLGSAPASLGAIRVIHVDLTVQGPDGNGRRMTTRIRPRSLPWP